MAEPDGRAALMRSRRMLVHLISSVDVAQRYKKRSYSTARTARCAVQPRRTCSLALLGAGGRMRRCMICGMERAPISRRRL